MDISLSNILVSLESPSGVKKELFKVPSFQIQSGERVLLRGESGQGKTTFLHLLAGLFLPDQGSVKLGSHELTQMSEDERSLFRRQHIGMVFQKLNLIEYMTVLENIELSSAPQLEKNEVARKALSQVGLEGRERDLASVMSLGEQQRVAIARVLASEHSLVFADEPTSSLDDRNTLEVMDLLTRSCEGKTLLVVSHDHRIEKYFSRHIHFGDFTS